MVGLGLDVVGLGWLGLYPQSLIPLEQGSSRYLGLLETTYSLSIWHYEGFECEMDEEESKEVDSFLRVLGVTEDRVLLLALED